MPTVDAETTRLVANRLKRAAGQLNAVIAMVESGRDCEEVVTQLAAVSKAVDRAGFKLLAAGLRECVKAGEDDEVTADRLEKLFLTLG